MKRFIGVIILSGTFTLLTAGQEAVTGASLQKAIKEERTATNSFCQQAISENVAKANLRVNKEILSLLDQEGATIEKLKNRFKQRSDESAQEYDKAKEDSKEVKEKLDASRESTNKQIRMAAKKL